MATFSVGQALVLAVQQHQAGNLQQAERIYEVILQADPCQVDALLLLGLAASQRGQLQEAGAYLRQVLRLKPDYAVAHYNLGNVLQAQGQRAEALACFRQALHHKPDFAEAHNSLAVALQSQGQIEEAAAGHRQAVRCRPDYAEAHNNLGVALQRLGQLGEAAASYRQALLCQPGYAEAHNNLAVVLQRQGQTEEAVASYREALRLKPAYAEAYNNLGDALLDQGQLGEAEAALRQALHLKPDYPEAYNNLGVAQQKQGKLAESLASYGQSIRLQSDYAEAHLNRALAWLLAGEYEQGWPEFEWRFRCQDRTPPPCPPPLWDGSLLQGQTVLLRAEQGLGDTLQFIRYAALLKQQGAAVVVECQQPLVRLLAGCPGIDQLLAQGNPLPEGLDCQAFLLSLPGLLGTTLASVPAPVPYLHADPRLVEHWAQQLRSVHAFRIGITWQGNLSYHSDRVRSIPLGQFAPLARLEGVQLVSLQKGPGTEQLREVGDRFSVLDLGSRIDQTTGPFLDTAAVMKHLDLVVTCDTVIGHLAGALGVPVWVALPFVPDWRWLLHRDDSPWYPTVRLFRQTEPGDWPGVFERMAAEVSKRCP
jgi:Tfp pilus assembly protein PilF